MTSKQMDALQQYADAVDAFIQAFGQDFVAMTAQVETQGALVTTWAQSNPVPDTVPAGWTVSDEQDYQQELKNLKARIAAAGPSADIAIVKEALTEMSDPQVGRSYFLKAKANGWL